MVNIQFPNPLLRRDLTQCAPARQTQTSRNVWNGRYYLDVVSSEFRKVSRALVDKDPVQGLDSVGEQTGEG